MGERGLMDSVNDVVKAAFELYAADGKKLNDGDSFTVKLNNGALTISVKDKTLRWQQSAALPASRWPF